MNTRKNEEIQFRSRYGDQVVVEIKVRVSEDSYEIWSLDSGCTLLNSWLK